MAAEARGDISNDFGSRDCRTVDRDLVCARQQQRPRVLCAAHAAADGQWHEAHFCRAPHDVNNRPAPFMACANIEKTKLVRTRRIIGLRLFDWVARIAQVDKVHTFDHAAIGNVEAGNDADADGHARPATLIAVARSNRPS